MKVKTISYQKVFPLGQYINERIGVEIDCNLETESPFELLKEAKEFVEKFHKDSNPQLYQEKIFGETKDLGWYCPKANITEEDLKEKMPNVYEFIPTKQTAKEQQVQNFKTAIETTTNIKNLLLFDKLVQRENNPILTDVYNLKLKSFNQ